MAKTYTPPPVGAALLLIGLISTAAVADRATGTAQDHSDLQALILRTDSSITEKHTKRTVRTGSAYTASGTKRVVRRTKYRKPSTVKSAPKYVERRLTRYSNIAGKGSELGTRKTAYGRNRTVTRSQWVNRRLGRIPTLGATGSGEKRTTKAFDPSSIKRESKGTSRRLHRFTRRFINGGSGSTVTPSSEKRLTVWKKAASTPKAKWTSRRYSRAVDRAQEAATGTGKAKVRKTKDFDPSTIERRTYDHEARKRARIRKKVNSVTDSE